MDQGESRLLGALVDDLERSGLKFDPNFVHRLVASLMTKRFVILTGVTGSGKTRLAQAFAYWLSGGASPLDSAELSTDLMHDQRPDGWLHAGQDAPGDQATYRVDAVDSLAVQFSNERKGQRVKVTLPNELISEWIETIQRFGFSRDTPARDIREQVAKITGYSTQLNSFETHLKAAAFAILEQRRDESHSGETQRLEDPQRPSVEKVNAVPVGSRVEVVAVGADWHSSESVLGYPDALQPDRYIRTPTLDLILRAKELPELPHFLILDEMNLSHVERYFSDILSSMESGEPIHLYSASDPVDNEYRDGVPASISLPDNLFIIGTVNVDETTYMFSPKVLDRASTIEFRVSADALEAFLKNPATVDLGRLHGKGARFAPSFLSAARNTQPRNPESLQSRVNAEIGLFFAAMADHGSEFGFRTALEMSRFVGQFQLLDPADDQLERAIDALVYQKILPRLSGSRARLEPVLRSLLVLCRYERKWSMNEKGVWTLDNQTEILAAATSASDSPQYLPDELGEAPSAAATSTTRYPLSESKILRMFDLLRQNGFTSFAEA